MITSGDWLTPTRSIGLAAYGIALTCCAMAWMRSSGQRLAAVLMVIDGVLLLDITFNWRWRLHAMFAGIAQSRHEYEQRRLPQAILLLILAGLLLIALVAVIRIFRNRKGALLAVAGGLLSVIAWCVEVVSLHQVDHVLYHQIGSVMVVSFFWILACLMTSVGVLVDWQESRDRVGV